MAANDGHHRGLRAMIKVCWNKVYAVESHQELKWVSRGALTYSWGSNREFSAGSLRRFCIFLFSPLKLVACKKESWFMPVPPHRQS